MNNGNEDLQLKKQLKACEEALPAAIRTRIDATLNQLPTRRTYLRKLTYTACVFVLFIGGLIGSGFLSPTMAQTLNDLPFFDTIFSKSGDKGLRIASRFGLTTDVNQTVRDQNIGIEVNEVLYDGSQIAISYINDYGATLSEKDFAGIKTMDVLVNDRKLVGYTASNSGYRSNDNEFVGIITLYPKIKLPEEFELTLNVQEISGVSGDWNLTFPVSKNASNSVSYTFNPNTLKTVSTAIFSINKVFLGPSATDIEATLKYPKTGSLLSSIDESEHIIRFELIDDKGEKFRSLNLNSMSTRFDTDLDISINYYASFTPTEKRPEYFILRTKIFPDKQTELSSVELSSSFPLTLDQGEIGEINVTSIEHHGNETLVTYKVEGYDPIIQANNLWFEDKDGNKIESKVKAKRLHPDSHTFSLAFPPLNNLEDLKIVSAKISGIDLFKDMEIKIPIDWSGMD